jgi:hypothetical protein
MQNKHQYDQWFTESEEDDGAWSKSIKNKCFLCEIKIKNCFDYYMKYGNCCVVCSSRVTRTALDYKNNGMMCRILLEELVQRRKLVKMGVLIEQSAKYI